MYVSVPDNSLINGLHLSPSISTAGLFVCVCVCVREREREYSCAWSVMQLYNKCTLVYIAACYTVTSYYRQ